MVKTDLQSQLADSTLMATIAKLRRQHRDWLSSRRADDLYRFLQSVFGCYSTWKRDGIERSASSRIAKLTGLNRSRRRHPIRAIIDATSAVADRRTKSRWTRALRHASLERSEWKDLIDCLRLHGGIAGCAQKFADLQAETRTPPGFMRVGSESRVPKVPLYVDATLLDRYGDYSLTTAQSVRWWR